MKQLLTLTTISLMLLTACSPESKPLYTQKEIPEEKVEIPKFAPVAKEELKWITEDGGQSQIEFNPRIDILFVVDNSDSMKSAQENLKRNMDKFTSGIKQNRMIDYHIGVISTWDSTDRAQQMKKDSNQLGDLHFIKDASGKTYNQRFLTRANQNMIASTLAIGVTPYEQGGPEVEEFFAPLAAALEKTGHAATNENFFRDDAQLVVIMMTDADDSTNNISPEQMARILLDFKKGDAKKLSVYGVLVKNQDADEFKDWGLRIHPKYHPECFNIVGKKSVNNGQCKGFGPEKLQQFIVEANSTSGNADQIRSQFIMGITSPSFGKDLGRIGDDITAKTLEKDISLSRIPRYDVTKSQYMIRVRYGITSELAAGRGQLIPEGKSGWTYRSEDNAVHLSGLIKYQYVEGAHFAVDLIPVAVK